MSGISIETLKELTIGQIRELDNQMRTKSEEAK